MLELDFESDPADIRNPETLDDNEESRRQRTKLFKYRQSLRVSLGPLVTTCFFLWFSTPR